MHPSTFCYWKVPECTAPTTCCCSHTRCGLCVLDTRRVSASCWMCAIKQDRVGQLSHIQQKSMALLTFMNVPAPCAPKDSRQSHKSPTTSGRLRCSFCMIPTCRAAEASALRPGPPMCRLEAGLKFHLASARVQECTHEKGVCCSRGVLHYPTSEPHGSEPKTFPTRNERRTMHTLYD